MDGSIKKSNEKKHSTNPENKSSLEALEYWLGILGETYRHKWNPPSLMAYRITLEDLPAEEIEGTCKQVLKTWKLATMPPPGFIRECTRQAEFLGPPQLHYPDITPEEREAALEFSAAFKKTLEQSSSESPPVSPQFKSVPSAELDEMLAKYQEWLATEAKQDEMDRAAGRLPVPRHEAERLAIFLALPVETRRRMARSGEWTKLITANI